MPSPDSPDAPNRPASTVDPVRNMLDVFANWYRRAIIYALQNHDGPMATTTLVRTIADWDDETGGHRASADHRSSVIQAHILEMDDFGVIRYDPVEKTVRIPDDVNVSVIAPATPADSADTNPTCP